MASAGAKPASPIGIVAAVAMFVGVIAVLVPVLSHVWALTQHNQILQVGRAKFEI